MKNIFSHLRVSSEYSISQGLLTIDQIIESAKKNTIPSVALTDKSNMFAMVKFFNKCEASGIKPISGASIRVIFDEMILLMNYYAWQKTMMGTEI